MQIISGIWRGKKLFLPHGARPTQNMARAALFNMMTAGLWPDGDLMVWDAFAGSGAFGIECLSRYPECHVVFTDVAPHTVRRNLANLCIDARARLIGADAMTRIAEIVPTANVIFVDPPYADPDTGAAFVRRVGRVANAGTILIWEQEASSPRIPDGDTWDTLRDKTYGRARFLILRRRA